MKLLIEELWKEEKRLQKILVTCQKIIKRAPSGKIRLSRCKNSYQYYFCDENEVNSKGRFVRKKELTLAQKIIEKEYAEKLNNVCKKRLEEILRLEEVLRKTEPEEVIEDLPEGKRQIIQPIVVCAEKYGREWEKVLYQGKPFPEDYPEIYSDRGERVRSKTEKIIADKLYKEGIPYRYEEPLFLEGYGEIYPDFRLLNVDTREEIILEHFGMMDDLGYVEKAIRKIRLYERNGYFLGKQLLITFETAQEPFDSRIFENMLKEMGFSGKSW